MIALLWMFSVILVIVATSVIMLINENGKLNERVKDLEDTIRIDYSDIKTKFLHLIDYLGLKYKNEQLNIKGWIKKTKDV